MEKLLREKKKGPIIRENCQKIKKQQALENPAADFEDILLTLIASYRVNQLGIVTSAVSALFLHSTWDGPVSRPAHTHTTPGTSATSRSPATCIVRDQEAECRTVADGFGGLVQSRTG